MNHDTTQQPVKRRFDRTAATAKRLPADTTIQPEQHTKQQTRHSICQNNKPYPNQTSHSLINICNNQQSTTSTRKSDIPNTNTTQTTLTRHHQVDKVIGDSIPTLKQLNTLRIYLQNINGFSKLDWEEWKTPLISRNVEIDIFVRAETNIGWNDAQQQLAQSHVKSHFK
jgi:hypothetical protein